MARRKVTRKTNRALADGRIDQPISYQLARAAERAGITPSNPPPDIGLRTPSMARSTLRALGCGDGWWNGTLSEALSFHLAHQAVVHRAIVEIDTLMQNMGEDSPAFEVLKAVTDRLAFAAEWIPALVTMAAVSGEADQ